MVLNKRILLLLPCNSGVRYGDYMLGGNWRLVYRILRDLVDSGIVTMASVDSCKPGIVLRGEEYYYTWCDVRPYWDKLYSRQLWRLELLINGVIEDLRELALRYTDIVYYINVKSYRMAVEKASSRLGLEVIDAGPPLPSPLAFRARRNLLKLRNIIINLINNYININKESMVVVA